MAHTVEGNEVVGFRVVTDAGTVLTGRKRTESDALAAAGVEAKKAPAPAKRAPAKKTATKREG